MSTTSLARALALSSSALALSLTMAGQSVAQQQGDVQIRPAAQSVVDSLDSLEQLLLAPLEEANRLNIYVTPRYQRDRFDAYNETGDVFLADQLVSNVIPGFVAEVDSPEFTVDSNSLSFGADYLLDDAWLFGAQLNYTNADFDYDTPSEAEVVSAPVFGGAFNGDFFVGDPVDREIDEYGISLSAGYLAEPWTALLTVGYSRRNIEIETRKASAVAESDGTIAELSGLEADFNSNIYSVDLGGSYRWRSGNMSLQPYVSIGYQIEDVDGYTEELTSLRQRLFVDDPTFFTRDPADATDDATSEVDDQTITSIPGRIGVLFSTPLGSGAALDDEDTGVWKLRSGLSFTHDFSNQERRIRSVSNIETGAAGVDFSVAYEEENRNRNFFSFTAALGYDFSAVNGSLNYQHDIGLDERSSADILSLQVRVPF